MLWNSVINFVLKLFGAKPIKLSKEKQLLLTMLTFSGVFFWVFLFLAAFVILVTTILSGSLTPIPGI
tara:strand:+ start:76 stop:276 length:201 start_codon:yes stop_codon:yes gene_type:complete